MVWLAFRILLAVVVAALFGAAIGEVPSLLGDDLRLIAGLTLVILPIWGLVNAFVSALANGALARLLLSEFLAGDRTGRLRRDCACGRSCRPPGAARGCSCAGFALRAAGPFPADHLLIRLGSPQAIEIIAHRGAAGLRPENTMSAVVKAIEDGADWIEIDVQETADGEVVVAHDSDFMKSAGVDLKVWNVTMADLARIDIGSSFDPAYSAERTPTLRDVLLAARGRSKVMIELKYYGHNVDLEDRVARIVEETGMTDQIAVMSLEATDGREDAWPAPGLAHRNSGSESHR